MEPHKDCAARAAAGVSPKWRPIARASADRGSSIVDRRTLNDERRPTSDERRAIARESAERPLLGSPPQPPQRQLFRGVNKGGGPRDGSIGAQGLMEHDGVFNSNTEPGDRCTNCEYHELPPANNGDGSFDSFSKQPTVKEYTPLFFLHFIY